MSDPHAMQRLCGLMRKAVQDYEMISPGDKIMVGVSGGKDSVALTIGLAQLRRYLGFDYKVVAVTLDPQFDHQAVEPAGGAVRPVWGPLRGAPHRDRPHRV